MLERFVCQRLACRCLSCGVMPGIESPLKPDTSCVTYPLMYIHNMRKLEQEMCRAIDDDCQHWSKANTSVIKDAEGTHHVYLHGNEIAQLGDDWIKVSHAGWKTNTTRSRLRALLTEFGDDTDTIYQKDFVWYVNDVAMTNAGWYGVV